MEKKQHELELEIANEERKIKSIEKRIKSLQRAIEKKKDYQAELDNYNSESNTVLFYDGFGLDTRGVAIMYLKENEE